MKNSLVLIFFLSLCSLAAYSQLPDVKTTPKRPFVIAGAGVSIQFFDTPSRQGNLFLELPINPFSHIGLQFTHVFDQRNALLFDYGYSEKLLSYEEVGLYYKYFFHGRLTGRRSNFYLGPEIKVGERKIERSFYSDLPPYGETVITSKQLTIKAMLRMGMQWQMGRHSVLEIAFPLGVQQTRSDNPPNNSVEKWNDLILIPTVSLGVAL